MTKYREILRLKSLGFSERNIAHSCGVSRNTVAKVVKKAAEIKLSWPLDHDMTDSTLEEMQNKGESDMSKIYSPEELNSFSKETLVAVILSMQDQLSQLNANMKRLIEQIADF